MAVWRLSHEEGKMTKNIMNILAGILSGFVICFSLVYLGLFVISGLISFLFWINLFIPLSDLTVFRGAMLMGIIGAVIGGWMEA